MGGLGRHLTAAGVSDAVSRCLLNIHQLCLLCQDCACITGWRQGGRGVVCVSVEGVVDLSHQQYILIISTVLRMIICGYR